MFESLSQRTVIIGNSGAGKSALAESLAALILVPVIDLDLLNWEGDSYGRKRDEDAALTPFGLARSLGNPRRLRPTGAQRRRGVEYRVTPADTRMPDLRASSSWSSTSRRRRRSD